MMRLAWINEAKTALTRYVSESHAEVLEPGHPEWETESVREDIEPYIPPPPPSDAEIAAVVRAERDRRLGASDWTQLPDAPVNGPLWAAYRQELRDIPGQAGFPHNVIWPTPPA